VSWFVEPRFRVSKGRSLHLPSSAFQRCPFSLLHNSLFPPPSFSGIMCLTLLSNILTDQPSEKHSVGSHVRTPLPPFHVPSLVFADSLHPYETFVRSAFKCFKQYAYVTPVTRFPPPPSLLTSAELRAFPESFNCLFRHPFPDDPFNSFALFTLTFESFSPQFVPFPAPLFLLVLQAEIFPASVRIL